MGMLQLIRQLAKYGPISIQAYDRRWWVVCLVRTPGRQQEGIAKANDPKLYFALLKLIEASKEMEKALLEKLKAPKQQEFEYGSLNPDWREIA